LPPLHSVLRLLQISSFLIEEKGNRIRSTGRQEHDIERGRRERLGVAAATAPPSVVAAESERSATTASWWSVSPAAACCILPPAELAHGHLRCLHSPPLLPRACLCGPGSEERTGLAASVGWSRRVALG
jgi:hypothetical protein